MRTLITIFFILCVISVFSQSAAPEYYVSDVGNSEKIAITTNQLDIIARDFGCNTEFTQLQLAVLDETTYLLAFDKASNLLFAFELQNIDGKLYINIDKHVSACESDKFSINIFSIKDGRIAGCNMHSYREFGRN